MKFRGRVVVKDIVQSGLLVASIVIYVTAAAAQQGCLVMDPTSTPLNVRAVPGGSVLSTFSNGTVVVVLSRDDLQRKMVGLCGNWKG